jgi:predicted lipid-binding transport protein (Tim44 family)
MPIALLRFTNTGRESAAAAAAAAAGDAAVALEEGRIGESGADAGQAAQARADGSTARRGRITSTLGCLAALLYCGLFSMIMSVAIFEGASNTTLMWMLCCEYNKAISTIYANVVHTNQSAVPASCNPSSISAKQ